MDKCESGSIEATILRLEDWQTMAWKFLPLTVSDRDDVDAIAKLITGQQSRIAELEAELEGLKKQEPVAYVLEVNDWDVMRKRVELIDNTLPVDTWLYAQPVQPAVPDATQEMVDMVNSMEGWSGFELEDLQDICIAMRAAAPKEK